MSARLRAPKLLLLGWTARAPLKGPRVVRVFYFRSNE